MQKKIIALAIASALTAPAAFADTSNVSVYGVANVSYDLTNNGATGTNQVSSNASRLGLKGSEDLGDGLSAVWQIESGINFDSNNTVGAAPAGSTLATRNTFAGLSGGFGTAILGRHDTPYKIATRGLDVFADSIADSRSLMGSTAGGGAFAGVHDTRLGDVAAYISPTVNGFTGAIAHVSGAELASAAGQVKGAAWSMAGLYGNGPIFASLAYQVVDTGTAGTGTAALLTGNDKVKAWKLGGGYTMDAFQVNAAYEHTSNTIAGVSMLGQNNWYLSGKFNVNANDAVKLAYTSAGDVQATTNTGAKQWALGYDHNLSKRTTVYGLYTRVSNDMGAAYTFSTQGSTGGGAVVAAGQNPSAWSFGMKHTF